MYLSTREADAKSGEGGNARKLPGYGRFLQADPIGYQDSPNLYAYVGNDPINFVDPLGLDKKKNNPNEQITGTRIPGGFSAQLFGSIGGGTTGFPVRVSPPSTGGICENGVCTDIDIPPAYYVWVPISVFYDGQPKFYSEPGLQHSLDKGKAKQDAEYCAPFSSAIYVLEFIGTAADIAALGSAGAAALTVPAAPVAAGFATFAGLSKGVSLAAGAGVTLIHAFNGNWGSAATSAGSTAIGQFGGRGLQALGRTEGKQIGDFTAQAAATGTARAVNAGGC